MSVADQINEMSGTARDTLSRAMMRAAEEGWKGVIVLGMADDNGCRFLKSATLNDMETMGLVRWATLLADDQSMEDLTEPEESL